MKYHVIIVIFRQVLTILMWSESLNVQQMDRQQNLYNAVIIKGLSYVIIRL